MQHTSVVQIGQVGHILALLELGRVHLLNVVLLDDLVLASVHSDGHLLALGAHDLGRQEALLLIGNPAVLLAVERSGRQLDSLLLGHFQVLERLDYLGISHINHLIVFYELAFFFKSKVRLQIKKKVENFLIFEIFVGIKPYLYI
jgi:hypothetical protein